MGPKQKGASTENIIPLKNSFWEKLPYLLRTLAANYLIKRYTQKVTNFSLGYFGIRAIARKGANADVIHLHWINDSFIDFKGLKQIARFNKPVFWTLHDLWPITGGCHYNGACQHFTSYCHQCPELNAKKLKDLSHTIWSKKQEVYKQLRPVFIAPSRWMADQVQASSLGRAYDVHVIPNAIDHTLFYPQDQGESRAYFNLPANKRVILFGAVNATYDSRKGFLELMEALRLLEEEGKLAEANVELLVFGNQGRAESPTRSTPCHFLGPLQSETALRNCYNAADYLVVPSKQDNLPNTIMEALACGLPSVGFNTGGIPEMIEHEQTGFLAKQGDSRDLAHQLKKAVNQEEATLKQMKAAARNKVLNQYTYEEVARQHINLYQAYLNPPSES